MLAGKADFKQRLEANVLHNTAHFEEEPCLLKGEFTPESTTKPDLAALRHSQHCRANESPAERVKEDTGGQRFIIPTM